jgi:outer membrane protein assembly factor BamB
MITQRALPGACLALLLAAGSLPAQISFSRVYTRPEAPPAEVLRRLNLNLAWKGYVPMDGRRDGILRVDLDGRDLFVMTRSGLVVRMDAETGKVIWRTRVGKPYSILPFLATNGRSVYLIANVDLFGIDRATGTKKWEYRLPGGVSAAPVVDKLRIYISTSAGRLYAYKLPLVGVEEGSEVGESLVYGGREVFDRRPRPIWEEVTNIQLAYRPVQTSDTLFVVSPDGQGIGYSKFLKEGGTSTELYSFRLEGKVRFAPSQFIDIIKRKGSDIPEDVGTAYIASDDSAVYAVNMTNGKLRWRHNTGTPVRRKPIALQKDVFITSEREGLARLDRIDGDAVWRIPRGGAVLESNAEADQFLAANDRFVYANDRSGRLLILDRKRGVKLSMLDTTQFPVPVVNEVTDRLYLMANDGLIVCLHDRDQVTPIRHRQGVEGNVVPVLKILETKIKAPGLKAAPLRDVLARLTAEYKIEFVVVEAQFRMAGNANVEERVIETPKADDIPLKEYLQRLLTLVNATYRVSGETILIVPGKPAKK